jgi:hypothetical protein
MWHKDKWVSPAMAAFQELMQAKLDDSEAGRSPLAIAGVLAG